MTNFHVFYLPVAHARPQARIIRERLLPHSGEVSVEPDQRVEPPHIVARAAMPAAPLVVNLAQRLGVPPKDVKGFLLKAIGDEFNKDEVLASKKGRLGRVSEYRAPGVGRLLAEHEGQLVLEIVPALMELPANINGVVTNVMPRYGVVIELAGGLAQGIWGNGKENYGVLKLLGDKPDQALTQDIIDVSYLGALVVVGGAIQADGLKQATALQVHGVIAGSMPASLRDQAMAAALPIMITEGFGSWSMAAPTYELLKGFNGREAALRAVYRTRGGAQRPELVSPLPQQDAASAEAPPHAVLLQKGALVRVGAGAYLGQAGRVVSEKPQTQTLAGGIRARAVEIALGSSADTAADLEAERVWIPIHNLEAIG
ncbi:MAG: hypothetical protein HY259_04085 [Chloroflexi bacterium]|nr:hypothetical protein [Chloroflexota bacterium]MBI3732623.1 hypothetical protein [Chloroflexota bacterium]